MSKGKTSHSNKKFVFKNSIIVLMLFINSAVMAIVSIIMGKIVDSAGDGKMNEFMFLIFVSLLLIVIRFLAQTLAYSLIYGISCKKLFNVKSKLFKKDLIYEGWKNVDYSTNLDIIYNNRYITLYSLIDMVITLVLSIFTLFSLDRRVVIIGLIGALIPVLSPILTQKRIRKNSIEFAEKSQVYQRFSYDHLNIKDEINRYNVENQVYDKYNENSEVQEVARFKFLNLLNFASILSSNLGTTSVIVVLLFAGILVSQGVLTAGMLISVMQLTSTLVAPILQLSNIKTNYESSRPIFNSYHFDKEYEFKKPEHLPNGDLEVKNIFFSYDNTEELFNGISKTFEKGKKYLIQGQSGRGKSTLAAIISGELKPKKGNVYFNGHDIYGENIKHNNIGYQNQVNKIFTGSVYQNIDFYRDYDPELIKQMHDNLHLNPSLDKIIEPTKGISGGEKTLVALSRALMEVRDVMIFDEPTTGLNDDLSEHIINKILELPSTVIVISHISDKNFAERFDDVINL